jgi:glycosyltransferase involved in cell wall biosynthesis
MRVANQRHPSLFLLSAPAPIRENPYQQLLYGACRDAGATILPSLGLSPRTLHRLRGPSRVLHVHWLWLKPDPIRRLLGRRRTLKSLEVASQLGWKIVWTVHNLDPHEGHPEERELLLALARRADGVIAHTRAHEAAVRERTDIRGSVTVIPHGHYRDVYPSPPPMDEARQRLGLPSDRPVLLFFGHLRAYKGVLELVEAFRRSSLDATLVIAGRARNPRLAHDLARAAEGDARLRLDVRFIPPDEMSLLFGAADRVVFPFRRVTTSGSLILALSFGRPVIIPDDPGLREVAPGDAAEVFFGPDDLIGAIDRALRQAPARAAAAATAAADRLDWGPIGKDTVAFMQDLFP